MVELEQDMKTVKSGPKYILEKTKSLKSSFFEASSIRKFGEIYYFIYSSNISHALCYATAASPEGPFVYRGWIHSNGNVGVRGRKKKTYPMGNNHGSIVEIDHVYYVFGHRHTNGCGHMRQGIAEEIHRNTDGTFEQAEYTSGGLNRVPLLGEGRYPAYIACCLTGECRGKKRKPYITQDEGDREGGEIQYITNIRNGANMGFTYFSYHEMTGARIRVKVRGAADGILKVMTSLNGDVVGNIPIRAEGSDWMYCESGIQYFRWGWGPFLFLSGKRKF